MMLKTCIILLFLLICISVSNTHAQSLDLPENYPEYNFTVSNSPDEGYLFITTRNTKVKFPAWMLILDTWGTPVYYRYMPLTAGSMAVQKNGLLSFRNTIGDDFKFYIMDSSYVVIDSAWMDDYILDSHDFIAMENGHFLLFGLDARIVDMTAHGGVSDATLMGCVIRELDENKNTVFEWNSWDYFEITDTYKDLTAASIDIVHPNCLEIDQEGDILHRILIIALL